MHTTQNPFQTPTPFLQVLVSATYHASSSPPQSGGVTYEHIVGILLGPRAKKVETAVNLLSCLGASICFLILVADIIVPVISSACTATSSPLLCFFAGSRAALISSFAITIALPFSMADNMGHLVIASFIAALSVFVIAGLLASQAAASSASVPHPSMFNPTKALILGIPITIFSFGNHTQVVPLFADLPPSHPHRLQFHRAVIASNALAFFLYIVTGLSGYAAFGVATRGDVLLNLDPAAPSTIVAKTLMGLHM